jgi:hypothetical protein
LGFWDFFRNKKNEDSNAIESPINKDDSHDIIFAKNFTSSGGRFTFIDEKNSTNEIFEKIIEENQWNLDSVCSLDSNISKNLGIRLIRKIDNDNVKALVTECEFLLSNTGRILICNKQIKSNRIENLPPVVIILANSSQFVSDVSEGMSKLKAFYSKNIQTNITTLNAKNSDKESDFLSHGNSSKNIYLLLEE